MGTNRRSDADKGRNDAAGSAKARSVANLAAGESSLSHLNLVRPPHRPQRAVRGALASASGACLPGRRGSRPGRGALLSFNASGALAGGRVVDPPFECLHPLSGGARTDLGVGTLLRRVLPGAAVAPLDRGAHSLAASAPRGGVRDQRRGEITSATTLGDVIVKKQIFRASTPHTKGKARQVIPTQTIAKPASTPKTGLFPTLCAFLHLNGSGAPKIALGTGTPKAGRWLILSVLATTLGALAFTTAPALAAGGHVFEKSFDRHPRAMNSPTRPASP